MDILKERELYIKKLDSQICGMSKLLNPKFQDIIFGVKAEEIKRLSKKAEILKNKLSNNEFEIAIIGLEKAGKSTFANALMGNDILPSMDARCTYTSTSIRYGTNDYAEVVFFTREEFNKKFVDNLRTMGVEHAENYDLKTLSLNKYRELFEQLPDEKKNVYRASVNEDVENILEHKDTLISNIGSALKTFRGSEQLESIEFKKYIQDPAFAVSVKEITIHSSKLSDMQNAVLYDVPGFDSPTQIHREQTVHMMSTADVIIMIANAGKPSITGPQVQIFEGEVDQDGIPFNEKIFVFGNKADTANDAIETNISVLKSQLEKYRIVRRDYIDRRVVIGSARAKLEMEGKIAGTGVYDNLKAKGLENGIDEIHKKLENYNDTERFEILKKRINRIYNELEECLAPELADLNELSNDSINISEIARIAISCTNEAQYQIKKELEALKSLTSNEFESLPLSNRFNEVISSINSTKYIITEAEKNEAINAASVAGMNLQLNKFERILRDEKYNQIYDFFIKTVIDIGIETHKTYDEKIRKIFLDALKLNNSSQYYNELLEKIANYVDKINPEQKEGYYRSLAERFITDIFETLIRPSFGDRERWDSYRYRRLNLFSLAIFHRNNVPELPADRQPMLYSILFHDKFEASKSGIKLDELVSVIKEFVPECEEKLIENKFSEYLKCIFVEKKECAVDFLRGVCDKRPNESSERFLNSLYNYLNNEYEFLLDNIGSVESYSPEITLDYYDKRCKDENLASMDTGVICEHLHQDIDILGEILLNAAIPAIQIDKAFVNYIVRCIENIIMSVDPNDKETYIFGEFVTENISKIKYGNIADIESEEKKKRLRREICTEIQKILSDVKIYDKE